MLASPGSGYTFTGWSGGCSGAGACTITATTSTTINVTAIFSANTTTGCGNDCGNVGDPYEGGGFDPSGKTALSACGSLSTNTSYYLTGNVGADPSAICFGLGGAGITLDLRGYTVTGRIRSQASNANGDTIFNGTVSCNISGLGEACIRLASYSTWTAKSRVHHVFLNNAFSPTDSSGFTSLYAEYETGQNGTNTALELDHITCTVSSAPASNRAVCLNITTFGKVDVHHNDLACPGTTSACNTIQVIEGTTAPVNADIHHNRFTLATNTLPSAQASARGVIFSGIDQSTSGPTGNQIHSNVCVANNNRCFRLRQVRQSHLYNNHVINCTAPKEGGCYVIGDPDNAANAIYNYDTLIENETIEMNGGKAFWIRNVGGVTVRNVTVTGTTGKLGELSIYSGSAADATFCNVPSASALDIDSTAGSQTTVGIYNAGVWTGAGTVNPLFSCP